MAPAARSGLQRAGQSVLGPAAHAGADDPPPRPPSVGQTGRLYCSASAPSLAPNFMPTSNVSGLTQVRVSKPRTIVSDDPKSIWTDSLTHLPKGQQWPAHAVPLFAFTGEGRPCPAYREEINFTITEELYCTFVLKFRSGIGDHYGGGSIGLVHLPDRQEATPGSRGQLVMVTNMNVNPDTSVTITCVGDLDFTVLSCWMPRGLLGLQLATVQVDQINVELQPLIETFELTDDLGLFGRLVRSREGLAQTLSSRGPYTVFAPTDEALLALVAGAPDPVQALLEHPDLEAILRCHVCQGKVPVAAMYSNRMFQSIDGSLMTMSFKVWPRGEPSINGVPISQLDTFASNGVVHSIVAVLAPKPQPAARPYR
ncbi:unnamed protein product [Prorocentrum cordatum]|uniref:FAS1 domain-containing protein n=1 Tax=Prorocentrum cordatum TaxID=2364126 RepID=A0ABN9VT74_9DINO|nr:unnamed protein product [Polarella glacialis]